MQKRTDYNGVTYFYSEALYPIRHGFSTRLGGLSRAEHTKSLNLGFYRGDKDIIVQKNIERFCEAGADIVTVHVEADTPENTLEAIRRIRACGKKPAVCVKPKTPAEAVLPYLELVDLILVMTVEPGFGGQSFMADMMPKVSQIRKYIDARNPACELEVDGGVNAQTARLCTAAGANVLVAGSAFFKAEDKAAFVKAIKE